MGHKWQGHCKSTSILLLMSKKNIIHRIQPAFQPVITGSIPSGEVLEQLQPESSADSASTLLQSCRDKKIRTMFSRFLQFWNLPQRKMCRMEEEVWIAIGTVSMDVGFGMGICFQGIGRKSSLSQAKLNKELGPWTGRLFSTPNTTVLNQFL